MESCSRIKDGNRRLTQGEMKYEVSGRNIFNNII